GLGDVPFGDRPQLSEVGATRAVELLDVRLQRRNLLPRLRDDLLRRRLRLAAHQLGLARRLVLHFLAQLLRRDQGLVDRLVALAVMLELLVAVADLGLELAIRADQALEFLRQLLAELVHALAVVAAHRAAEVIAPHIHRRQVEDVVATLEMLAHPPLVPKRTVPRRTIVAPSSTAIT